MISEYHLKKLVTLISAGKTDLFYSWQIWQRTRVAVFALDNYECQYCKAAGKYSRAEIVHHVKHLRDRPDLALTVYDGDERQLVSCCKKCHELQHPESLKSIQLSQKNFITTERWD